MPPMQSFGGVSSQNKGTSMDAYAGRDTPQEYQSYYNPTNPKNNNNYRYDQVNKI